MSVFSAPGSVLIKTILEITAEAFCSQHTDLALIKTSTDNNRWQTRQCDTQTIEFPRAYTLLGKPMVI